MTASLILANNSANSLIGSSDFQDKSVKEDLSIFKENVIVLLCINDSTYTQTLVSAHASV